MGVVGELAPVPLNTGPNEANTCEVWSGESALSLDSGGEAYIGDGESAEAPCQLVGEGEDIGEGEELVFQLDRPEGNSEAGDIVC